MKKLIRLIFLVVIVFLGYKGYMYLKENDMLPDLSSIKENNTNNDNKENKDNTNDKKEDNKKSKDDEIDLTGIPEEWINIFKFDNVTIKYTTDFFGHTEVYFYFADGEYYKLEEENYVKVEDMVKPYVFDYTAEYKYFTLDEERSNEETQYYVAIDLVRHMTNDDENLQDVTIEVSDGKVRGIEVDKKLSASLHVYGEYYFYNYDATIIENNNLE